MIEYQKNTILTSLSNHDYAHLIWSNLSFTNQCTKFEVSSFSHVIDIVG